MQKHIERVVTHFKDNVLRLKGKKKQELNKSIIMRDRQCMNPFCKSGYPLDIPHHIVFKSHGGSDTPENLITLCVQCHELVHREWLNVKGTAPNNLAWMDKRRKVKNNG